MVAQQIQYMNEAYMTRSYIHRTILCNEMYINKIIDDVKSSMDVFKITMLEDYSGVPVLKIKVKKNDKLLKNTLSIDDKKLICSNIVSKSIKEILEMNGYHNIPYDLKLCFSEMMMESNIIHIRF